MSCRPFYVNRIPNSNLLLIVINKISLTTESTSSSGILSTEPIEMETGLKYGVVHPCHKLYMNTLPRRRLDECFVSEITSSSLFLCRRRFCNDIYCLFFPVYSQTEHEYEEETAYCGSSYRIERNLILAFVLSLLSIMFGVK